MRITYKHIIIYLILILILIFILFLEICISISNVAAIARHVATIQAAFIISTDHHTTSLSICGSMCNSNCGVYSLLVRALYSWYRHKATIDFVFSHHSAILFLKLLVYYIQKIICEILLLIE